MRKTAIRFLSMIIVSILLVQNVFATGSVTIKNKPAETIGRVPEEFQSMVNGNWAISEGEFSSDGYYRYISNDGKVKITKYNIFGEKQYETEYDYKYAGKDRDGFLNFRYHTVNAKLINDNGDTFFSSRVLRSVPLLGIDLPSKHNLVKVDSNGNVLWEIDFGAKEVYLIRGMVEADDGSLILGVTKKTKWINADVDDFKVNLIKLSADGEVLKQVDLKEDMNVIDNLAYVDGKGFFGVITKYVVGDSIESKHFLTAFDEELNLLWEREINESFYPWDKDSVSLYGYPVKEKSDKVIPLYQRKSEKLTRIDFNNKVVSECVFKTNIKNEYIDNIHFLNNGEYIVEYGRNNSEDIREENARFVHYSKDFKELRELALTGYSIREIIETED